MNSVTVTATHIGTYPIHQLCQGMPWMPDEDWPKFRDSIGANGLKDPIVRYASQIIDGRKRLTACLETLTPPRFIDFQPKGKTSAEIDAEIRLFIKIKTLDRAHLSTMERARALAMLFPPVPRGGQAKPPTGGIKPPTNKELAKTSGVPLRTLERAREQVEDENAVKKGCIKAIQALVGKELTIRDAANVSDLDPKQQRACLKEFQAGRRASLSAARAALFSNRDGLTAKTELGWVLAWIPMLGESDALRIDMVEKGNSIELPSGEVVQAEAVMVGKQKKQGQNIYRCYRCSGLMLETDSDWAERKIDSKGIAHRQCPSGKESR